MSRDSLWTLESLRCSDGGTTDGLEKCSGDCESDKFGWTGRVGVEGQAWRWRLVIWASGKVLAARLVESQGDVKGTGHAGAAVVRYRESVGKGKRAVFGGCDGCDDTGESGKEWRAI